MLSCHKNISAHGQNVVVTVTMHFLKWWRLDITVKIKPIPLRKTNCLGEMKVKEYVCVKGNESIYTCIRK